MGVTWRLSDPYIPAVYHSMDATEIYQQLADLRVRLTTVAIEFKSNDHTIIIDVISSKIFGYEIVLVRKIMSTKFGLEWETVGKRGICDDRENQFFREFLYTLLHYKLLLHSQAKPVSHLHPLSDPYTPPLTRIA